jgi:hypothetical protein
MRKEMFIAFVLYEYQGAHDATFFFVGVSLGRAEHSLAGPFQSKAAACAWIEILSARRWRSHRKAARALITGLQKPPARPLSLRPAALSSGP